MPIGNTLILRTGILYSIIICALISISCLYSSFLISLKTNKSEEDAALSSFLNVFGFYWLIYLLSNIFGWLNIPSVFKPLSILLNFLLVIQPIPLFNYLTRNKYLVAAYSLFGFAFIAASFGSTLELTNITFWGIQAGVPLAARLIFSLGLMAPLALLSLYKLIFDVKKPSQLLTILSITLVFALLETANIFLGTVSWELLLLRMFYILIGFIAYFYLSGEEATTRFASKVFPLADKQIARLRQRRIPFFTKLLLLFVLLSVLPIAAAGSLLFLTFKEIIDLYIYKPLLWNLKTSQEEFLIALGNVQVQSLFLIMLTIILVIIASSIASRAIAQSLKRRC